jgi:hypothetical protein
MSFTPRAPERKQGRLRGFMLTEESWQQSLKDHQKRMGGVRPTINFKAMPWGFDADGTFSHKLTKRPASSKGQAPSRPGTARSNQGRPQPPESDSPARSARGAPGRSSAGTPGRSEREEFGIAYLPEEQQRLCREMIRMLTNLKNSEESRRVVEEIFVNAEESRLLRGYTGVFPSLDRPAESLSSGRTGEDQTGGSDEDSPPRHTPQQPAASRHAGGGQPPERHGADDKQTES